jgi:hypothetical protein
VIYCGSEADDKARWASAKLQGKENVKIERVGYSTAADKGSGLPVHAYNMRRISA